MGTESIWKSIGRLADGRDIPCFGLTSPEAGSDAASMIDSGIICKGSFEGHEVLGLRLNWHKRYITLGPVATLLGLAFKAYDPDHLVGPQEDLGISVALIPTATVVAPTSTPALNSSITYKATITPTSGTTVDSTC